MPLRPPAGFIRPGYDPLEVPDAPTIGTATAGDATASVTFTAPSDTGGAAISEYYAVSNPDQVTATTASSPVSVTGLTNETAYTFRVWALNSYGPSPYSAASGSVTPFGPRGFYAGGFSGGTRINTISYFSFAAKNTVTDFGDLTVEVNSNASCASSTRGIVGGGYDGTSNINVIGYITISTTGNATDFGDLTVARSDLAALSNETRGIFIGGGAGGTLYNVMDYITIASAGNATDFGDLNYPSNDGKAAYLSATSSTTRGIIAGGQRDSAIVLVSINYLTIATTANSSNFGDLTVARRSLSACSSSTRAVFSGGFGSGGAVNNIDYVTIATTGNATDFGDNPSLVTYPGATSDSITGIFNASSPSFVTIATTGNATSFSNAGNTAATMFSSAHGGLS